MSESFGLEPLQPAYGRDYKSLKALEKDFDADKDFKTAMGQYINKPQLVDLGKTSIRVRYARGARTGIIQIRSTKKKTKKKKKLTIPKVNWEED